MSASTLRVLAVLLAVATSPSMARAHPAAASPDSSRRASGIGMMGAGFGVLALNAIAVGAVAGVRARETSDENFRRYVRPLAVPVVGPWVATARANTPGQRFGAVTLGIVQAAMLGLGVAGAVLFGQERHRRRHEPGVANLRLDASGLTLRF